MPQLYLTVNSWGGHLHRTAGAVLAIRLTCGIITPMPTLHLKPDSLPQTGDSQIVSASLLRLSLPQPPKSFYRHGWQSWSLAAWTDLTPLPVQQPKLLHPMQVDPVHANDTSPNSSWVAAVELAEGDILLLGALGLAETDAIILPQSSIFFILRRDMGLSSGLVPLRATTS